MVQFRDVADIFVAHVSRDIAHQVIACSVFVATQASFGFQVSFTHLVFSVPLVSSDHPTISVAEFFLPLAALFIHSI